MVLGLDVFKAAFAGLEDQYVLIGGTATEAHLEAAGLEFRATKDLDIVLCLEALNPAFVETLWAFVEAGDYQTRERDDGKKEFFRFSRPADPRYPATLELFSRVPDVITVPKGGRYTPIPTDGSVESLSAMLLDDDYYAVLQAHQTIVEGVPVLSVPALIAFKAHAYNNLARDRAAGLRVDGRNVTKHRSDVFKLLQLAPGDQMVTLPESVQADVRAFLAAVEADAGFDPKTLGLSQGKAVLLERLIRLFSL